MTPSHGQLTRRITDSATVSVVEVSCRGELIRRPLAKADGTNRSVRRPPHETLGGLPQAVIHPHCFGAGGMTVNNPFTVTGRNIPSYKNRPRRETRRSHNEANSRGVNKGCPDSGLPLQRTHSKSIQQKRWDREIRPHRR